MKITTLKSSQTTSSFDFFEIFQSLILDAKLWDWGEIIQSSTGFGLFVVACMALTSWKQQQKTQRITDFLDKLTDAVHDFIRAMSPPIQHLEFIHIFIESNKYQTDLREDVSHPAVVKFIEKQGGEAADALMRDMKASSTPYHQIKSLLVKGQAYEIPDYADCFNACQNIVWQHERLQIVYAMLNGKNLVWENPEVQESLKSMVEVTPQSINQYIQENQIAFLNFVRKTYRSQFKS